MIHTFGICAFVFCAMHSAVGAHIEYQLICALHLRLDIHQRSWQFCHELFELFFCFGILNIRGVAFRPPATRNVCSARVRVQPRSQNSFFGAPPIAWRALLQAFVAGGGFLAGLAAKAISTLDDEIR